MPATVDRYLLLTECSAANRVAAVDQWDRQMEDRQVLDCYTDPAPYTMRAVTIMLFYAVFLPL